MEEKDKELLSIYNELQTQEHPDPIGFLARSDLLSGLSNSFSKDGKQGITGIREEDVNSLETSAISVTDNLAAAVKTDLDNYSTYGDIVNMHAAFIGGPEAAENRKKRPKNLLRQLNKKKKKFDSRIKELKKNESVESNAIPDSARSVAPEESVGLITETPEGVSEFVQAEGPANILNTSFGSSSRLEEIRGSFKGLNVKQGSVPKKRRKGRTELRNIIRRALRSG